MADQATGLRRSYWDRLLIADDALQIELFDELFDKLSLSTQEEEGIVNGCDPEDTKYKALPGDWNTCPEYFAALMAANIVPVLPNHDIHYIFRGHTMHEGGKMATHADQSYSIAVSIYLSECKGGRFRALDPDSDDEVLVAPRRNRAVVIKCETFHSVLEVEEGERKSIQVFIRYSPKKKG
jgi:hypothetical protein